MKQFPVLILLSVMATYTFGQSSLLKSGPMIGYSEMREVMLWVQTSEAATVHFTYHEKGEESPIYQTAPQKTRHDAAFTAHCLADQVQPGQDYIGNLFVNGKKVDLPYPIEFHSRDLWHWRTDPPAFKFAIGSCSYTPDSLYDRPGKPYGGDPQIFGHILEADPDFMVWLGDNIYLREADWNTMTGIHYRYTYSRSQKYLQPLLARVHHYAIWDDHDFGPNDSDRSFVHKDKTLTAFKQFWANPSYGVFDIPGITTRFSWSDCDFFLLDNRYHRANNWRSTGERTLLGEHQIQWLIDALKGSRATFKFVCIGGMVLSTAKVFENYITIFPDERLKIMNAIQKEGINGVIFLDGDRHHTELTKWEPDGQIPVYDLTVSPLTATAYGGDNGKNELLVPKTEVGERNFATLEVKGPKSNRVLTIRVYDKDGKEKWKQKIKEKEMYRR